jgi:hypothetical protein
MRRIWQSSAVPTCQDEWMLPWGMKRAADEAGAYKLERPSLRKSLAVEPHNEPSLDSREDRLEDGCFDQAGATAGRFLVPDWSVNGNGTSTTSAKSGLEALAMTYMRS